MNDDLTDPKIRITYLDGKTVDLPRALPIDMMDCETILRRPVNNAMTTDRFLMFWIVGMRTDAIPRTIPRSEKGLRRWARTVAYMEPIMPEEDPEDEDLEDSQDSEGDEGVADPTVGQAAQ